VRRIVVTPLLSTKTGFMDQHYLTAAAKACGLPLLEPEKYQNAYHTDFDFDESSLTIIRENGCVNLSDTCSLNPPVT